MSTTIFADEPKGTGGGQSGRRRRIETSLGPPLKKINLGGLTFVTSATTLIALVSGGVWIGQQVEHYKSLTADRWTGKNEIEAEYLRSLKNRDYVPMSKAEILAIQGPKRTHTYHQVDPIIFPSLVPSSVAAEVDSKAKDED